MVSVLHKQLQYEVKKLKEKKAGGHEGKDQNQNQIRTIHTEFLQSIIY